MPGNTTGTMDLACNRPAPLCVALGARGSLFWVFVMDTNHTFSEKRTEVGLKNTNLRPDQVNGRDLCG